ncbi:hypothetical protein Glove_402g19 [Diversispora epigaea]|nr:hypothetical protein Glove_402g19 [Diversispora epigaea]
MVGNKLIGVSVRNQANFITTVLDPDTGYNIPEKILYTWEGSTLDTGENFKARMEFDTAVLMDKIDVLNEIPYFLKKIVQAFVAKPYVYQWFNDTIAYIKIGDKDEFAVPGKLFSEATFIY